MTLGASEFAGAPNGLGASPFSLAPMPVADARAVSIPPMAWGSANPVSFLNHWARRIAVQDPLGFTQCGQDPHVYLVTKLFQTLSIIKRPGFYGWQFLTAGPSRCIQCFVYCDGARGRLTELGTPTSGFETWWPCIVIWEENTLELAFYCPALAWQNARPWGVHVSRLRRREILSPTTPAVLHSLPTPDSVLPLDNAVQPAADDSSDAEDSEVEWEIVDDDLAV